MKDRAVFQCDHCESVTTVWPGVTPLCWRCCTPMRPVKPRLAPDHAPGRENAAGGETGGKAA